MDKTGIEALIFFIVYGLIICISVFRMMRSPIKDISQDEWNEMVKYWDYIGNQE